MRMGRRNRRLKNKNFRSTESIYTSRGICIYFDFKQIETKQKMFF